MSDGKTKPIKEPVVDAIAIEMERVSEGQRFTTKLLSERVQADQERRLPSAPSAQRPDASH